MRAIAVALVIANHLRLPLSGGAGQVGVRLFFVLSGYLIASLLLAEWRRSGTIDLRAFYVRRVRRLMPALGAVIVIAVVIAATIGILAEMAVPVLLASVYLGDFASGWHVDMRYIVHTWTLGLEEQLYLLWPPLLLFAMPSGRVGIVLLVATGAIALLFLTTSTAALLAGCVLAFAAPRLRPMPGAVLVVAGVALVLLSMVPPGVTAPEALAMDLFSFVLLAALVSRPAPPSALTWRPVVYIGTISYGIYLWHPLVFVVAWPRVAGVAIVLLAAMASDRWIERPFRHRRSRATTEASTVLQAGVSPS
ncbi:MAG: acyltransferase [Chloroflexi bacterium]|nr:acyltransferase [Chloroflexota bacterium]